MAKDSKFRIKPGTWIRRITEDKRQTNLVINKSTVPDGYVRLTNCNTGEIELITHEEFERREDEIFTITKGSHR